MLFARFSLFFSLVILFIFILSVDALPTKVKRDIKNLQANPRAATPVERRGKPSAAAGDVVGRAYRWWVNARSHARSYSLRLRAVGFPV
ncbi:hypothetical protein BDQ17DRAFT_1421668 [Cyathus striatus]|nr:hypothetical protein BDQ17DRAFT_1421668 [Cyathus striatus]